MPEKAAKGVEVHKQFGQCLNEHVSGHFIKYSKLLCEMDDDRKPAIFGTICNCAHLEIPRTSPGPLIVPYTFVGSFFLTERVSFLALNPKAQKKTEKRKSSRCLGMACIYFTDHTC